MPQQGAFTPAGGLTPLDPSTFLIGSGLAALGGAMAPAPSTAMSKADGWGMFDSSGWTVATGGGDADGAIVGSKGGGEDYGAGLGGAVGSLSGLLPWLIVGGVVVALAKAWKRK